MEQQYLQPTTYIKTIENLSNVVTSLHIENAVLKAQFDELNEYVTNLQEEKEAERPMLEHEEIINE